MNCPDVYSSFSVIEFEITATDNLSSWIDIIYDIASGSVFKIGTTVVTATASDEAANRATCWFKVVRD